MRFLKNKILWLTVYAMVVTGVFLYFLFPSELALQQLEASASSSDFVLKAGSLRPALPLGIKLKDMTMRSAQPSADVFFQGELLDLQFSLLSFFQKYRYINFNGKAYSGNIDGRVGFTSFAKTYPPVEGKINFQDIDLAKYGVNSFPLFKGMTGRVRGLFSYFVDDAVSRNASGKLSLYLTKGAYVLPEPFLGVSRIEFDHGEVQAQLKSGRVMVEKLEMYGGQMNCFLSGDIQLADRMDQSLLNLKGVLEIAGKNKIKMNVTVGGTLASPSFRYI
jgi:type II secretion system protein N